MGESRLRQQRDGADDGVDPLLLLSSGRATAGAVRAPSMRRSLQGNSSTSMPCPMATTLPDGRGNERRSTDTTASAAYKPARSIGVACQCVYQSSSGTRPGRHQGAANTVYTGAMCASTATGRGRQAVRIADPNRATRAWTGAGTEPDQSAVGRECVGHCRRAQGRRPRRRVRLWLGSSRTVAPSAG